jgi:AbrB family looped-hinge helix DNA binding protein
MSVSRVNTKGQVTIPQALRERLGFRPGDEVEFIEVEGGLRIQKRREGSLFSRYRGYLSHLKGQDPDALLEAMRGR